MLQETLGQWREVFYLAAAIDLGANLFYLFFASTEEQVRTSFNNVNSIHKTTTAKSCSFFIFWHENFTEKNIRYLFKNILYLF